MCMQALKVLGTSQAAATLTLPSEAEAAPGVQLRPQLPQPRLLQPAPQALQGFQRLRSAMVQPWSQQVLLQITCMLKEDRGEVLQGAKQAAQFMLEQITPAQLKMVKEVLQCRVRSPNPDEAVPELHPLS